MSNPSDSLPSPHVGEPAISCQHTATDANGSTLNGAADHAVEAAEATASNVRRAEELTDQLAARVASVTASLSERLICFGAQAKEFAQDVWAEAQSIRQKKQP